MLANHQILPCFGERNPQINTKFGERNHQIHYICKKYKL